MAGEAHLLSLLALLWMCRFWSWQPLTRLLHRYCKVNCASHLKTLYVNHTTSPILMHCDPYQSCLKSLPALEEDLLGCPRQNWELEVVVILFKITWIDSIYIYTHTKKPTRACRYGQSNRSNIAWLIHWFTTRSKFDQRKINTWLEFARMAMWRWGSGSMQQNAKINSWN